MLLPDGYDLPASFDGPKSPLDGRCFVPEEAEPYHELAARFVEKGADASAAHRRAHHHLGAVERPTVLRIVTGEVAAFGEVDPRVVDRVVVPAHDQARRHPDDALGVQFDRDELPLGKDPKV